MDTQNAKKSVCFGKQKEAKEGHVTTWRTVVTASYILIGTFTAGYCMTALNSPGSFIMDFMNLTSLSRGKGEMSRDTQKSLYGLLSAVFAVGAGLSSLCTQKMADFIGRKRLLAMSAVGGLVSALLMGMSKQATSYEMLFTGRVISGFVAGVEIALAPFYLSEVLPKERVGTGLLLNTLMVMVSVAVVGIIGFDDLFATPKLWPVIVGSHGVFAVLQLLLMPLALPSPYFLLNKRTEAEAVKVLQRLRGQEDVTSELEQLRQVALASQKTEELTVLQLLRTPSLRKNLFISAMAFISMFFTGVIIINFYSVQVLLAAGLSERVSRYVATGVSCGGIVVNVLALIFLHRLSRRRMMLSGLGGHFFCGGILSTALIFGANQHWLQVVGVVCLPLMAGAQAIGPGQVPWLLLSELFTHQSRGATSSVCVMVLWLALFVIGYIFPPMQEAIGPYSVLPFVGLSAFFFVFFLVLQPETLGKAIPETTIAVEEPECGEETVTKL